MKHIGIFAGTFDPVHHGHIAFALEAAKVLNLEKVYLLPERTPRSKQDVTEFATRLHLIEKSVRDLPALELLTFDESQFSVSKTLPALRRQFPDARISLLIGSDVACHALNRWDDLDTLLRAVDIAIGVRHSHSHSEVETAMQKLAKAHSSFRYTIIDSPHAEVSSSQMRTSAHMS